MNLVQNYLSETWLLIAEMGPYLLLGFLFSGALHRWIREGWIESKLGKRGFKSIALACVAALAVSVTASAAPPKDIHPATFANYPEIVVLAFYTGNDVQNNSRALQAALFGPDDAKTYGRPYASSADLRSFCGERLPRFKVPREIEFRQELPRSHTGKLLRRKLR